MTNKLANVKIRFRNEDGTANEWKATKRELWVPFDMVNTLDGWKESGKYECTEYDPYDDTYLFKDNRCGCGWWLKAEDCTGI